MSLLLKYNTFYLLAEITLNLGLQSTEEYFPYIAYAFFCFFVLFKIHAANIEASKFFVFVFVGDHGKLFPKCKVVCTCYCYNFHIFLRE